MSQPEHANDKDVTVWVQALGEGDEEAATRLWEYCFPRLLRYSKSRLPSNLRKALDEEDVALSAFKSLCRGAERGGLQDIESRDELWKLLTCITARKARGYILHETRQKRGGGKVRGESIFHQGNQELSAGIHEAADDALGPALLAQIDDQCRQLLDLLNDDMLQTIALLRMEGYAVDEIATRVGCARRSVERRLNLIRRTWRDADAAGAETA